MIIQESNSDKSTMKKRTARTIDPDQMLAHMKKAEKPQEYV